MSSPKAKRKQRTPLQRVIRWGPWHYRFWREIARWCYEQSLHNPAVVPADDGFPAHRQLLESYQQIRQETLEVALSGRLPANHDIMQQQRTRCMNSTARSGGCCPYGAMATTTPPIRR